MDQFCLNTYILYQFYSNSADAKHHWQHRYSAVSCSLHRRLWNLNWYKISKPCGCAPYKSAPGWNNFYLPIKIQQTTTQKATYSTLIKINMFYCFNCRRCSVLWCAWSMPWIYPCWSLLDNLRGRVESGH